ncbi:NAD(P)/FAD-dependent oxidoreductase [candidate division KSB1 bacterium]
MSELENGNTVIIIGGGPAGTSCAIHIKKLAEKQNKDISVILIEPKTFGMHYNQCVGVLNPQIIKLLDDIGITFPETMIQRNIEGYHLNVNGQEISLPSEGHDDISYALRRKDFDSYMMGHAFEAGVQVVRGEVVTFDYSKKDKKHKLIVYGNSGTYKGDFIVGAFGVGNGVAREFFKTFGYRPPRVLQSIVTKIHPLEKSYINGSFGNYIRAYMPVYKSIEFGAITPKGNHMTVNIAGEKVTFKDMEHFLTLPEVKKWIPEHEELTFFKGQFPTGPAHHFYGDDYLIIGDAAGLVRPFKGKGVNSAILSGKVAAETIVTYGTSAEAINRNFIRNPQIQRIIRDYKYGNILRKVTIQFSHHNLLKYLIKMARKSRVLEAALYSSVSANRLYKEIILNTLREFRRLNFK